MSKTLAELEAEYRRLQARTAELRRVHLDAEKALRPFQESAHRAYEAYAESLHAEMDASDALMEAHRLARADTRGEA